MRSASQAPIIPGSLGEKSTLVPIHKQKGKPYKTNWAITVPWKEFFLKKEVYVAVGLPTCRTRTKKKLIHGRTAKTVSNKKKAKDTVLGTGFKVTMNANLSPWGQPSGFVGVSKGSANKRSLLEGVTLKHFEEDKKGCGCGVPTGWGGGHVRRKPS